MRIIRVDAVDQNAAEPDLCTQCIRRTQVGEDGFIAGAGILLVAAAVGVFDIPQKQVNERHKRREDGRVKHTAGLNGRSNAGISATAQQFKTALRLQERFAAGKRDPAGRTIKRTVFFCLGEQRSRVIRFAADGERAGRADRLAAAAHAAGIAVNFMSVSLQPVRTGRTDGLAGAAANTFFLIK